MTGASEPLRRAAADAICELTENWEPPMEGEGCIYQPLSCASLILIGYGYRWLQASMVSMCQYHTVSHYHIFYFHHVSTFFSRTQLAQLPDFQRQ